MPRGTDRSREAATPIQAEPPAPAATSSAPATSPAGCTLAPFQPMSRNRLPSEMHNHRIGGQRDIARALPGSTAALSAVVALLTGSGLDLVRLSRRPGSGAGA